MKCDEGVTKYYMDDFAEKIAENNFKKFSERYPELIKGQAV